MLDNKELIMKNWYIYLLCILVSSNFFACQDDDLEDQSIFDGSTEITVIQEVFDITLVSACVSTTEGVIAECRMKIFLDKK